MKDINILSLIQASSSLQDISLESYLNYYGIDIKKSELKDLKILVDELYGVMPSFGVFEKYYVGYKIPQIGKEFDLLRIGENFLINIEIKSASTEEKVLKQLLRNRYYLSYLCENIYNICYISSSKEIYLLKDNGTLTAIDIKKLVAILLDQKLQKIEDIDTLFDPSDYLVSPFNSTQKFLDSQYFLTHQQEDVKSQVLKSLSSSTSANFISIVGSAGTGKTLLVYDLSKELMQNGLKPLIIHCGYLNEGQQALNSQGWSIIPIKSYKSYDLSSYDVVIIDEAQRLYPDQLDAIVDLIVSKGGNCIFSYDKLQTLAKWEEARDIDGKINKISPLKIYKLSERIRTNKEIAAFIKMLFNNTRNLNISSKGNIEINYFYDIDDAKTYLESLDENEWEVLRFTPSQYKNEHHEKYSNIYGKTSHKVIGQEFDGVAVTMDQYFTYDNSGELLYRGGAYYYPVKMLFQNITRARKKLNLVIINNEEVLNRCVQILQ